MNPDRPQQTILETKAHEYLDKVAQLYLSQNVREQGYDIVNPVNDLRKAKDAFIAEMKVIILDERSNEISLADNRLGEEFGEDWLKFRDTRLKELNDERTDIRAASPIRE